MAKKKSAAPAVKTGAAEKETPTQAHARHAALAARNYDEHGRLIVREQAGETPRQLDEIEDALANAPHLDLFEREGQMVRLLPAREEDGKCVRRDRDAIGFLTVVAEHLVDLAQRAAHFERFDERRKKWVRTGLSRAVAASFLARGQWSGLRQCKSFAETPLVTQENRLIESNGFDQELQIYFTIGDLPGYYSPPEKPTTQQVNAALERLLQIHASFPFQQPEAAANRAAALAAILTAVIRRYLPASPMFPISATAPGSGKSLMADGIAIVASGRRAAVIALGHDDAEEEKRIGGILLTGDSVLQLDNIDRPLKSVFLCQMMTQPKVRVRILGSSSVPALPTNVLVLATGNGIRVEGDMRRRVIPIHLDAGVERPENREFDSDHLAEVAGRRGQIVADALTLIRAYLAAGCPRIEGARPFGGFETWDLMVRRPLLWLGLEDPRQTAELYRDLDPDVENSRAVLNAWHSKWGETDQSAAGVVKAATARLRDIDGKDIGPENPALHDALVAVCAEKTNPRRFGGWLKSHRGRIVDDLQLVHGAYNTHDKKLFWKVRRIESAGNAGNAPPTSS